MNTPFLNNAFSSFYVSGNITLKQGKQEIKKHIFLTQLEVKMQQKGMNMNQTFDYLSLGLSDAVVPANKALFLEESQLRYTFQRWAKVYSAFDLEVTQKSVSAFQNNL